MVQALLEEGAVGEPGERVVRGLIAQPRLRARLGERQPHQVDEQPHRVQVGRARNAAVVRTVGAHVADHLFRFVAQHEAERIAFVPRRRRRAFRVARLLAGEPLKLSSNTFERETVGNPAMVEQMHREVLSTVDKLELQLQRNDASTEARTGKPDAVPAGYQESVAEYYRRLSKNP